MAVVESTAARKNATKVTWSEVSNHLTQSDNQQPTTWVFPAPLAHWRCGLCGSVYQRATSSVLCKFKGILLTPRLPLYHIRHSKHTRADRNYFVFCVFFFCYSVTLSSSFPFRFILLNFSAFYNLEYFFLLFVFFAFKYVKVYVCVHVCKYTHLEPFCCSSAAENFAFCRKSK